MKKTLEPNNGDQISQRQCPLSQTGNYCTIAFSVFAVLEFKRIEMSEEIEQRAYEIVEELRADIDFELDDVIARIVRGLPEDYFKMLSRDDQLRQLKALLAMGVCNLDEEIMLRSEDGRQIAVVARKNYPGLLANILKRIPSESQLIGAKIFTSTEHDFIIDLFEFKPNGDASQILPIDSHILETTIEQVAQLVGKPIDQIRQFVAHYHPGNRILSSPKDVAEQLLVFLDAEKSNETAVRWIDVEGADQSRVTISSGTLPARDVFRKTAEFLAKRSLDVEQAYLHDFPMDHTSRMAIASFLVSGPRPSDVALDPLDSSNASVVFNDANSLQQAAAELALFL